MKERPCGRPSLAIASGLALLLWTLTACDRVMPPSRSEQQPITTVPKGVTVVSVQKTAKGFQLLRGGKPYFLQGAGGLERFAELRAAGGNSVRLWSTDYAGPLLDEAQQHGLTVMLGLWLEPESQHFTYYDPAAVEDQLNRVRQQVLRYRNHPALLMWSIGNEVEQKAKGPRLFAAINRIARMIHELDPYHPVTTALASDFVVRARQLQRVAPEVDILSVNVYEQLKDLSQVITASGWRGPFIVSEYNGIGYWQGANTTWGVPLEQNSTEKAAFISTGYRRHIQHNPHCLGGYAFYWGSKFEYTPTWLSLFEPTGEKTELVDELQLLWSKHYPANRAPRLVGMRLAGQVDTSGVQLQAGQHVTATVEAIDPEGDSLTTRWEVMPEVDIQVFTPEVAATPLEVVPGCILKAAGKQATVRVPTTPGPYRLFVRVFDGHGSVATANIPFLVKKAGKSVAYSAATTTD